MQKIDVSSSDEQSLYSPRPAAGRIPLQLLDAVSEARSWEHSVDIEGGTCTLLEAQERIRNMNESERAQLARQLQNTLGDGYCVLLE